MLAKIIDMFPSRRKEVTRIVTSKDLAEVLGAGYETDAGVSVSPGRAMQHHAVFACARVLAESIGTLPMTLLEKEGNNRHPAEDHSLYPVIAQTPNEFQTAQEFWEMQVLHLAVRGNSYSFKIKDGAGAVRELLPIHPDLCTPERDDDWNVRFKVSAPDGATKYYGLSDIMHLRLMSEDGVLGLSPISQCREMIGGAIAEQQHGNKLFKNGARLGGILSTDLPLDEEQRKDLREKWEDLYSGSENSFKTAVVTGGLKYERIGLDSRDSQFLEQKQLSRTEIAGIFRVPPHKIGDLENAHFTNIESQNLEFVTSSLMPYVTRIENRLIVSCLSPNDRKKYQAKFKLNSLLRGDMASRADFYWKMIQMGALSANEIRALEDMNERDGGDSFLTPGNMLIDGKPPTSNGDTNNATSNPEADEPEI